jgi:hypothetical protein
VNRSVRAHKGCRINKKTLILSTYTTMWSQQHEYYFFTHFWQQDKRENDVLLNILCYVLYTANWIQILYMTHSTKVSLHAYKKTTELVNNFLEICCIRRSFILCSNSSHWVYPKAFELNSRFLIICILYPCISLLYSILESPNLSLAFRTSTTVLLSALSKKEIRGIIDFLRVWSRNVDCGR